MKNQKGFVGLAILLVILGIVVGGVGTYWYMNRSATSPTPIYQPETATQQATQSVVGSTTTKNNTPSIAVTGWRGDGPATITVSYSNLPPGANSISLEGCPANSTSISDCVGTEWVEKFSPSTSNGTYVMSTENAFGPGSHKGILSGTYRVGIEGTWGRSKDITSPPFIVQ